MDLDNQIIAKMATLEERSLNTRNDAVEIRKEIRDLRQELQDGMERRENERAEKFGKIELRLKGIEDDLLAQKMKMAKWGGIGCAVVYALGYFIEKYLMK